MDNISISKMTPSDLSEVHRIFKESIKSYWSINELQNEFYNDMAYYLVLRVNDKPVAFCGSWLVFDEAQITNLAVDEKYRNRNLGTMLLKKFIAEVKNMGKDTIFLEVRESNTSARKFYNKLGFKEIGKRKNFYSDKETAVLMSFEIKNNPEK